MHPVLLPAVLALVLAGCATLRPRPLLAPAAQTALLQQLDKFSLRGRSGIRAVIDGETKGGNLTLSWKQQQEEAEVRLSGGIGTGSLTIRWRPGALRIEGGRDQVYENEEAEQILRDEIGFVPPFESLRYWILGLEAPGEAPSRREAAENGRLSELVQQQWRIRYGKWARVRAGASSVEMHRSITVTRDDLRLRVEISRWDL
jgi:outer membrane lipoprotein LolB